jgi:hypothetical protein
MPVGMTTTSVAQRRPWRHSRDYAARHPAIPAVPIQFTDTTNHRALTATFKKIRISACFVYSTPIKSCLNILDSGSQLEQPG